MASSVPTNFDIMDLLRSMKEDLVTMKKDMVTMKKDMVTLKEDLVTMKKDMVTMKKDMVTLKEDVVTLKEDVVTLKEDVVTLQEDVATKKDMKDMKKDMKDMKQDLEKKMEGVYDMQQKHHNRLIEVEALIEKASKEGENSTKALEKSVESVSKRFDDLNGVFGIEVKGMQTTLALDVKGMERIFEDTSNRLKGHFTKEIEKMVLEQKSLRDKVDSHHQEAIALRISCTALEQNDREQRSALRILLNIVEGHIRKPGDPDVLKRFEANRTTLHNAAGDPDPLPIRPAAVV
ncbi:hypothetical protein F4860DRAFT_432469 [Xylaria cubensis]|nr:hypothetical protein F4860DRAFT_432469 [Xylaria cubensis]